jgi:O-antigen ligase
MSKGKIIGLFERWFSIFTLLFSTTPIIYLFRVVTETEGDLIYNGDPLIQLIWFGIYLVNFFLIVLRWKLFIYVVQKNKLLLLITGLALVSALWSGDSIVTLRRSVALVLTTMFGVYLASRYSFKEQLQLLAWTFGIASLLSLLFVIVPPHYGLETKEFHAGIWRGIYHHKNVLGRIMSLSAVVFLLLALSGGRHKWFNWATFGFSFCLLMLSNSMTSLVTLLTILVLLPMCKALRWHYSLRIPFLITVVLISGVVGTFFFSNLETALSALGKDITLTGRTSMWLLLIEIGQQNPWLGYGYGAFWLGWDGPSQLLWNSLFSWHPNHAHNGFLQLWLDLGLIGLLLFTLSFIKASQQAVAWVRLTKTAEGFWPLLFLAFMLINNVTESVILSPNTIFWILYVTTAFTINVQSERERKSSHISTTLNKKGLAQNA